MTAGAENIPLEMLLVFGGAKLGGEIFERLRQPAIVGEILAGMIIGPSVLGWIAPNQVLSALADLGVMFLLFRVGLEVKSSELMRVGGVALLVATLGVALPFVGGWAILAASGAPRIEGIFVARRWWPPASALPPRCWRRKDCSACGPAGSFSPRP